MLNLSATATLRICATPDSKHVKETHLDQTVLVSARGTNRNTIQPLGQLEALCQDTTKKIPHKAMSAFDTPYQKLLTEQLPAGYLKWLGVEAQWRFSDTWGILAQRQMSGPGVMGCWTSQTMQNAAVCFEEGHQKPLLQSTCWRVLFQVCKSNVKIPTAQAFLCQTRFHHLPASLWWRNGSGCVLLPRKQTDRRA